jgi:peptidoglycan/LPS O-acetylase OafA/YrhL
MKTLSDYSAGRDNNFNLLRFVAASAVLVSHCYFLTTGEPQNEPFKTELGLSLGDMAVTLFFVTSGFLVTGSLLSKQSATAFFLARALRIYPGLWVAVLSTVLVSGLWITTLSPQEFFTQPETWRYVLTNMAMTGHLSYDLPGMFERLPMPRKVNLSLWSLPIEIRMYLLLGLAWIALAWSPKNRPRNLKFFCITVAVGAMALDLFYWWQQRHVSGPYPSHSNFYADLTAAFFTGAALRVLQYRVPVSHWIFCTLLVLLLASATTSSTVFLLFYKLTFSYLVLFVALVPKTWALHFNRCGDCSYGLYIYAFMVQQAIVSFMPGVTALQLLLCSFPVTLTLALLSWHGVEKRVLRLRDTRTNLTHSNP